MAGSIPPDRNEVTRILSAIELGEPQAACQLLPLVYDELRKLAARKLAHEKPGQTLQATALVHEAYLRLVGGNADSYAWKSLAHFYAAAAESMRRILVEIARRKQAIKHGGNLVNRDVNVDILPSPSFGPENKFLALNQALDKLAAVHPTKAELVKLRYFAGLTISQAAESLGISTATADRHWAYAKAWLSREIERDC